MSDVVDVLPPAIDVGVGETGEPRLVRERSTAMSSDRQREAVIAALELRYYDRSQEATHEDVAEVLDCAPTTASEHIKEAEAKPVRAAVERGR